MSDAPQGPGWWMASDGQWYPPQTAPPGYHPPGVAYGQPMPGMQVTHKGARNSLIFGIISFFCFFGVLLGPLAVYLGMKARSEISADPSLTGDGLALAGIICGSLGFASGLFGILIVLSA